MLARAMEKRKSQASLTLLPVAAVMLFAVVLIRTAWLSDDAYITLRTVDNIAHGYGPVWNVHERVQAFTHPLWMLLLSTVYFFTREAFYSTILFSVAISVGAAFVLGFGVARTRWTGLLAILAFLLAKAPVDFSTSGLENPLTHLLLLVFLAVYFRREHSLRTMALLAFVAALGVLNRADTMLLFAPALVALWWRLPRKPAALAVVIGFLPLILWELFAVFYYGFPLPNTAYAKLSTGIDAGLLAEQGLVYLLNAGQWQTFTPFIILLGMIVGVAGRRRGLLPIALAVVLYVLYVVRVGGDFMTGRFLSAPFILSLAVLSRFDYSPARLHRLAAAVLVLAVGLFSPGCPLFATADFGRGPESRLWQSGISDERAAYYQQTGLLVQDADPPTPDHPWAGEGLRVREAGDTVIWRAGTGLLSFFAGPRAIIVDKHALSDALLARLPTRQPYRWRIGHFHRLAPRGYLEGLRRGVNLIENDSLRQYADRLNRIISGSLADPRRLAEIFKFNTGAWDHLVVAYLSRPTLVVAYDSISTPLSDGTPWHARAVRRPPPTGMAVILPEPRHERILEISTDVNDAYEIVFLRDTLPLQHATIPVRRSELGGLQTNYIRLDSLTAERGYTRIEIYGREGDNVWAVGHLALFTPAGENLSDVLIERRVAADETLRDDAPVPAAGHPYDSLVILRSVRVAAKDDSLVFYFAFEAIDDITVSYRPFFHVTDRGDNDRFHNFDFRLPSRTSAWPVGQPVICRRAIPRLSGHLAYRLGLFNEQGRLGTPFRAEVQP